MVALTAVMIKGPLVPSNRRICSQFVELAILVEHFFVVVGLVLLKFMYSEQSSFASSIKYVVLDICDVR